MRNYLFIIFLFTSFFSYSQIKSDTESSTSLYKYSTSIGFGISSEDNLPFWMQANQFGIIPNDNYGLLSLSLNKTFDDIKDLDWSFGIEGIGYVSDDSDVFIKDYYIGLKYKIISLFAGAKSEQIIYDGLSSTNGNFIFSNNSRPYPKISLEIPYINIPYTNEIVKIKGSISEGLLIEDRVVDKPHIHQKNLYLKAEKGRFALEFGMNHYAQWGGDSPKYGKLPSNFDAYVDMFFAKDNSDYDQIAADFDKNRVGNHLGMLDGRFHYKNNKFNVDVYRQVIFEDSSGRNFFNRDALHGIYISRTESNLWFKSFLLEFYYTKKQSGDLAGKKPGEDKLYTGRDNYFNHSIYKSGWTNYGNTIGTPFFTPLNNEEHSLGIYNNRIEAIHGGVHGYILNKYPYKLLLTYTHNYGTYHKAIDSKQVSGFFEMSVPFTFYNLPFNLTCGLAADNGSYFDDSVGGFVKVSTNGWWNE